MGKRTVMRLVAAVGLVVFCTGCWDRVEINERGFVIGVAIDLPDEKGSEAEKEQTALSKVHGDRRFKATYQFVSPGSLQYGGKGGSGGGGGGGSSAAFYNVSSVGDSMDVISREFASRVSRSPYFEHLKMIIISEKVARSKAMLTDVLDFFLRDHEMRRGVKIMISRSEAASVLDVRPPNEKLPVMYLNSVTENVRKTSRMIPETKIGDIHEHFLRRESYALQSVQSNSVEAAVAGAAVIQGGTNVLVGFLDEEEAIGLNFVTNQVRGGVIKAKAKSDAIVYDIQNSKRSISADLSDIRQPRFRISIETEGLIGESLESLDLLKNGTLGDMEESVAQEIERLVTNAIKKLQNEYKADVAGLNAYLRRNHYGVWKTIKSDWETGDRLFMRAKISVEAKVTIRRIGTVNQTKRKGD
ncbi:Ger(x)C family spore germination protein [Paenibacillus flagellatus]|uniref:Ger(X)C family spore germination protein n=1 Tax=Paenibacillus flagellatus TaxID=2211139 RepID=A0A2V5KPA3_9BACL|nr:Ger(x)C family spore germination protein [Paenibacillus flagellatus]PYI57270.1 Ger(x)C family spore germination protein [Paenibacillus flagellatus]